MMRRFISTILGSSQPTIKQEAVESRPEDAREDDATNDIDMDMDQEDMIAIAKAEKYLAGSVELEAEEGDIEPRAGKKEKKGKQKGRKGRKSRDLVEEPEHENEGQMGGGIAEGVNGDDGKEVSQFAEGAQETVNTGPDVNSDDQQYAGKPKKRRRPSKKPSHKPGDADILAQPEETGPDAEVEEAVPTLVEVKSARKRKRKSNEADTPFEPEQDVLEEPAEEEVLTLVETKSAKNKSRNARSRKSRNAIVEEDTNEDEPTRSAFSEAQEESTPAELADLPKRLRRAKKKAKEDFIGTVPEEDDNDSAAVLHRPLTPAHTEHHRTNSNSHEQPVAQVQEDARLSGSADPEEGVETAPKMPSKKALGKRKASSVEVNPNKKQKKNKAAGTPELTSFGFTASSEPHRRGTPMFTPINRPRASILPPSAQRPPVDPLAYDDSDNDEYVPEIVAPKPSERKKKRRLPIGDDEPALTTPQNKGSRKSKTTKSATKTPQSRAPGTTSKGRLSNEEVDGITHAVEAYRDEHDLTQVEINDLIQKDAKTDGLQFWKYMYEEFSDMLRRQIQQTCRRKFHNFEARGSWTDEQDQELREAYEKYPNRWKVIGETLHRFSEDCRDRWRNYLVCGDNMRKDAWDKEEEERLKEVVQECIDSIREMKRISVDPRDKARSDEELVDWNIVSQKMGHTRSRLQCIQKWKKIKDREEVVVDDPVLAEPISETWRIEEAEHVARKMKPKEKLLLLYAIRESCAGREGKIPWKRLKDDVPGKPRRMAMRITFRQMRQHIEDNENMALQDIVDLLIDAFEASVPSEPPGFDDDFEQFRSSQKALSKKKNNKKKSNSETEVEPSSEDNDEGPSTVSTSKRKKRLSEKYVLDRDNEDDVCTIRQDEQPTSGTIKSKRKKVKSTMQSGDSELGGFGSATKNKRKLRERMKSIGQSESQSQERDDQCHSEISDVHKALESLKTGNSRARRAAAKEATKSKGKLSLTAKPFKSAERVVESDEEEQPPNEAQSTNEAMDIDEQPAMDEEVRSEIEEAQFTNGDVEVDKEPPVVDEEPSVHEQEELVNDGLYDNEAEQSGNDEGLDVNSEATDDEEPSVKYNPETDQDEMDLDKHDPRPTSDGSEANEEEPLTGEEIQSESDEEPTAYARPEPDEDVMDMDNQDTYTAPGGPEAENDDSSFEDEEEVYIRRDQGSVELGENEDEEESTQYHDRESVDLDASRDISHNVTMEVDEEEPPMDEKEPDTNGFHPENDVENEITNQASDAETDFHGFAPTETGSVELDIPAQADYRKAASPVPIERKVRKVNGSMNGFTNGHRHVEEEQVSSDDDDADIPAKIIRKAKIEAKREKKSKKDKKEKSKSKSKKRPVGFR